VNGDQHLAEEAFGAGCRHLAAGNASEAEAYFREAIRVAPDCPEAHTNLGLLLEQKGMPAAAEHHYRLSLALNPESGNTQINMAALLTGRRRFEEAEIACRRALELVPDAPAAWCNLGVLQACRKQETEAERSYRKAIELDPGYRLAHFNLSYLLLRQGRFEEGWRCLEARSWYAGIEPKLPCPRWQGEPLEGRALLLLFEAWHGDMIQFCRYAAVLKERHRGVRITLICHPALKRLFARLDGVDEVYAFDESFDSEGWDSWTPPFSVPFHCNTRLESIPAALPYLRADGTLMESWRAALSGISPEADLRVGLVWKGNPQFENDADRSLPSLKTLAPLGGVAGVRFFSLQKGAGEEEAALPPAGLRPLDLAPRIADFADAAAAVANLDLMICVDTAMAHLAGAMGKECWVLLPEYKTDWRWLSKRSDSPWYPGVMRLFRQPRIGDWSAVVAELGSALQELAAKRPQAGWGVRRGAGLAGDAEALPQAPDGQRRSNL
jgi:hypothetical protein